MMITDKINPEQYMEFKGGLCQSSALDSIYIDAVQEFDTNWEITALDGLSNETW